MVVDVTGLSLGVPFNEVRVKATNNSGSALAAGDVVLFDTAWGGSTTPTSPDPYTSGYTFEYVVDVGAGAATLVTAGIAAIATEAIADGARGEFVVRGRVEAAVHYEEGGTAGAIAAGAGLSIAQNGTTDKTALHGSPDVTATDVRTPCCAITLEQIADDDTREVVWVQFDGLRGFGAI